MGATQDPRATLIGNVQFNKQDGTYLAESLFVTAIQTPNAVILLDELTRAHPDAWNILMPVLDSGQRYLRLDEAADQATIRVAEGVTFIATANIGNQYTATRQLDKALLDRFTVIEMDILSDEEESGLLSYMFPNVDNKILHDIATIAHLTRTESGNESPRIDSGVSTRTSVELAGLIYDGFKLQDAAEITIYPQYAADGGVDSERTFVRQIVQKFISDGSDDELFTEEEMSGA
jgi:MoxR-like ATPase